MNSDFKTFGFENVDEKLKCMFVYERKYYYYFFMKENIIKSGVYNNNNKKVVVKIGFMMIFFFLNRFYDELNLEILY